MIRLARQDGKESGGPQFEVGQLVRHRRYGYRGVVVHRDLRCMADEQWYQSNQTKPEKNQPWYHVLVHERGGTVTYAAETSLQSDDTPEPVAHPLVDIFFTEFTGDRYVRNDKPWPG